MAHILSLPPDDPRVVYGLIVVFGIFLGIVGWSAVVGGVAYFLLMGVVAPGLLLLIPGDTAVSVPALPALVIAFGGVVGVALQRVVMAPRR